MKRLVCEKALQRNGERRENSGLAYNWCSLFNCVSVAIINLDLMNWMVYILKCSDGTFYTGISNNLKARIEKHNSGKGAKYTKPRRPVNLVYSEICSDKSSSLKREMQIKKLSRQKKMDLIDACNFSTT